AYLSATYNYYDTRRESAGALAQDSRTHSASALVSVTALADVTAAASWSGRFTRSTANAAEFDADDQNFAARAEYTPSSYLTGFVGKGYQISGQSGAYAVTEYVNVGATATRYLRGGVDTRLTFNRTIFQQSERTESVLDGEGDVVGLADDGDYVLDTYNAALNFKPLPYIRTYLDLSLTRNSDPVDPNRRYQFTRSLDARVDFSRRLEGRFTVTALSEGGVLKLGSAFSQNYNAGLTYIPRDNLNMNLTVIRSTYTGAVESRTTSLTGYMSYSFRRAFSVYASYNRRRESRERAISLPGGVAEVDQRPATVNGQLIMYLSPRTTLSLAYIRNETDNTGGLQTVDESFQTVVTLQI
ncbi:MAG TPA: hypothetical protein PKW75_03200, partial [candidate division Zixibacteria bacterium]|nr:hypothetical protein [candidate division Zixibacteria bacterium]